MSEFPSSAGPLSADIRGASLQTGVQRDPLLLVVLECIAVFVLGAAVMNYFYAASTARPGGEIGVPEYDSYYHIAMSSMLPEQGLLPTFPWLQYVYWRNEGDAFISHHVGFHLFLLPFVQASKWITGDYLAGGRWSMSFTLGVNLVLFYLLLRAGQVPWRWFWIVLFLLLPEQFFSRHGFARAIGPSFIFMQLALLMLFHRRYAWTGVVLFAYVQLYLGAVMYGPVIVAIYALARFIGPKDDAEVPWRMVLITAAFWMVGVVAYPYRSGMFEFLYMQVFNTGLAPTIEVGREWRPYSDSWFLIGMSAPLLLAWVSSLALRLRFGPPLDARATALLLLQFVFLILTCRARRFIEYWPPLCLLSAAYLAAPVLSLIRDWFNKQWREVIEFRWVAIALLVGQALFVFRMLSVPARVDSMRLVSEWQLWTFVAMLVMLVPLLRVWLLKCDSRESSIAAASVTVAFLGGMFFAIVWLLLYFTVDRDALPRARLSLPYAYWGMLAAVYVVVPFAVMWLNRRRAQVTEFGDVVPRILAVFLLAIVMPAGTLLAAGPRFRSVADSLRCNFDLDAIRKATDFLKTNSAPGDIVFTDDWDVFPVLFYHDRVNYYCVGLDPEFTHRRRPDLWDRYVKVTRVQVPGTITIAPKKPDDKPQSVPVRLSDIRAQFKARWVIADRDHRKLALALVNAPELAELTFPAKEYDKCINEPYLIFRIRGENEPLPKASVPKPDTEGRLSLSKLRPVTMQQGYGDLGMDRTVDGNIMKMHGKSYAGGLGTHAPSALVYNVPVDAAWFETVVGIDDEAAGQGTVVVSVELDGRTIYKSPVLKGNIDPVVLRLPVRDGKQISLRADATRDGQRFDHVDWADARFVISTPGAAEHEPLNKGDDGGGNELK